MSIKTFKQKIKKDWIYIFFAFLLLFIDLADYLSLLIIENGYYLSILWYCHVLAYLLIFAFLLRSSLLSSIVLISAIPSQFMWIVDFIKMLIWQNGSRTAWMFAPDLYAWWIPYLSLSLHILIIPLSIFAVWSFGFSKKSISYALPIATVVLLLTYFLTEPHANINCVFFPCDLNLPNDAQEIQRNYLYFSYLYLLREILFWWATGILTYILVYNTAKKLRIKLLA